MAHVGNSDRFIPMRTPESWRRRDALETTSWTRSLAYDLLVKNEVLGMNIEGVNPSSDFHDSLRHGLFDFGTRERKVVTGSSQIYSLYPISYSSQKLLSARQQYGRSYPTAPYKILKAPELPDDFYLNLIDWSSKDIVAMGHTNGVDLYHCARGQIYKLCLATTQHGAVTSVSWCSRGDVLAIGTQSGAVHLWDTVNSSCIGTFHYHAERVGALTWCDRSVLFSGSDDNSILKMDFRSPSADVLRSHTREVCSMKWSPYLQLLASGGNDNKLCIWDLRRESPLQTYTDHTAAVKGIAWSPHHIGMLASGGGTGDNSIRFRNVIVEHTASKFIDSKSQVCNLAWSSSGTEMLSTHGYSTNDIRIWKYPSLSLLGRLPRHKSRVIHFAMSPNGEKIATGSANGTVSFWTIFDGEHSKMVKRSSLDMFTSIR